MPESIEDQSEEDQSESRMEVSSFYSGKLTFADELAMPFLRESIFALIKEGHEEVDEYPIEIAAVGKVPTAFFGVDDAVVGILLFSHTPMGQWAINRICDNVWDKTVRPAFRKLIKRRDKNGGLDGGALTLTFGAWFETDNVFVQVIASLKTGEDPKKIESLVPEAFHRARNWIEGHGVQQPVLVYRIQNGNLSLNPTLADIVRRS
jgi:hypothetical protein